LSRRRIVNTVLVVDDRPDSRYSMARPLAAAGFDVRETATGREALRLARLQVDAIVLDLVLPDMDGYEVLRRLKTDPVTRNIPVILKTAVLLEDGHRELGLAAGAADYFAEPFDPQALIASVRGALGDGP
jgi:CheY-like chemotaxis protein